MKKFPDFSFETTYWKQGFIVIGIDEVGRGAFAGPVGVGGVVFKPLLSTKEKDYLLSLGINDSKKLTAKRREELSLKIKELAVAYHVSFIPVTTINEIGIGKATFLGMQDVAQQLNVKLKTKNLFLLVDAFEIPNLKVPQKGIIRGDSLSISIAAASIIAKVERDNLMRNIGVRFPYFGFEKHKGYGTKFHREIISKRGICAQHRTQFCKKYVQIVV